MPKSAGKKTPKISVVIPSLNKGKYIRKTLKSIFIQKYPALEVIIQDGGSTDETLEIINSYIAKYPGVISLKSEKDAGQTAAINEGLKKATGDILTYINADDYYEPGAFAKVFREYQKKSDLLWLVGFGNVVDTAGKGISPLVTLYKNFLLLLNTYSLLLMVNYIMQPATFFSKRAFDKYGPLVGAGRYVLEYDFWLKLGRTSMPRIVTDTLANFRMSGSNVSSQLYEKILEGDERIVRKYTQNPLVIMLHKVHNLMRRWIVKSL